jgi:hypothetical protein
MPALLITRIILFSLAGKVKNVKFQEKREKQTAVLGRFQGTLKTTTALRLY